MDIQDRKTSLLHEAKALLFFFGISSDKLVSTLNAYEQLYQSPNHVSSDEFETALNAVDAEIESLCLSHNIAQEKLEDLMSNNFSYKAISF